MDVDEVDVGLDALIEDIRHFDSTWSGGEDLGVGEHVDVSAATVKITHSLEVIAHAFRREELAGLHFHLAQNLPLRNDIHTGNRDLVDAILGAFFDGEDQLDAIFFEGFGLGLGDFDVGESSVLVNGTNGIAILFDLGWDEASALREESEDILGLGLHC